MITFIKKSAKFVNKIIIKILLFFIKFYQFFISPLLGNNKCRFFPTCSHYMIDSIEKNGVFKGLFFGIRRLLKCHPWSKGGFDPIK